MDRHVTLDTLPDGFVFPNDFADRFWYDAVAKRLCFRGFMSKRDFDRFCMLSESWPYRRALEELFRRCGEDETPGPRPFNRVKALLSSLRIV